MKIYFLSSVENFLRKISLGQMFSLSLSLSLSLSQTSMDQFFISLTLKSTFRKNKRVGMSYKPSRSFSHIHLLCLSFSFLHSHCISLFSCVLCLSNTLYPYPLYFSFYHTILSLSVSSIACSLSIKHPLSRSPMFVFFYSYTFTRSAMSNTPLLNFSDT